jgi:hypothetical protein
MPAAAQQKKEFDPFVGSGYDGFIGQSLGILGAANMRNGKRRLSLFLAVGYALTVSAAALFHVHAPADCDCCSHQHGDGYQTASDAESCAVCQFLAQKPVPADTPLPAELFAAIGSPIEPVLPAAMAEIFAAWRSRAPPIG